MKNEPYRIYRISSVLDGTLTDLGLFPKARKYKVFSVWPKAVGDVARYASPRRITDDILYVSTASSAWSQELTFMRREILRRLNHALGGDYVRDIRFSEHLWVPPTQDSAPSDEAYGDTGWRAPLTVSDDRLGQVAIRFAAAARKRSVLLRRKGYKTCEACRCLYPAKETECPYCRSKLESLWLHRAMAILEEAPHLDDEELVSLLGLEDPESARRGRDYLDCRYEGVLRALAAGDREERRTGPLAEVACRLTALRTRKPMDQVSEEDMVAALGKRYVLMLKRGRRDLVGGSWVG